MSEKEKKFVSWIVFVWVIGVITIFLLSSIGTSSLAISKANKSENDISWIRENMAEMKTDIKELLAK